MSTQRSFGRTGRKVMYQDRRTVSETMVQPSPDWNCPCGPGFDGEGRFRREAAGRLRIPASSADERR